MGMSLLFSNPVGCACMHQHVCTKEVIVAVCFCLMELFPSRAECWLRILPRRIGACLHARVSRIVRVFVTFSGPGFSNEEKCLELLLVSIHG